MGKERRIMATKLCDAETPLCSPVFDSEGQLFVAANLQGKIHHVAEGDGGCQLAMVTDMLNTPSSVSFDPDGMMYICDMAHGAILCLSEEDELSEFVHEYEGKTFLGPNTMVFDNKNNVYFTDSGPLGESTLSHPMGSVFVVDGPQQLLRPLAHECLAHPAGLALSPDQQVVYVAETLANRVLRFAQSPPGVFHMSVFHQFSGLLGPSALACDPKTGNLYVARYDFKSVAAEGTISVLSPKGVELRTLSVPAPEITGIVIEPNRESAGGVPLVITEASTGAPYRLVDTGS